MIAYPVRSSNIRHIGYELDTKKLLVQFHSGQWYLYDDVPVSTFGELLAAESVGKAFNLLVKKSGYSYRKVDVDFETVEALSLGVVVHICD